MRNFSLAMKTNSAYARLPLNGAQLPELAALDALVRARGIDLTPRLRKRPDVLGVPSAPEALAAQSLSPERVVQWLRQEGL